MPITLDKSHVDIPSTEAGKHLVVRLDTNKASTLRDAALKKEFGKDCKIIFIGEPLKNLLDLETCVLSNTASVVDAIFTSYQDWAQDMIKNLLSGYGIAMRQPLWKNGTFVRYVSWPFNQ